MARTTTRIAATILGAVLLGPTFAACGAGQGPPQASVPAAAKQLKGKPHSEVEDQLKQAGFTNVVTEEDPDLITGWLTKEGEVEKVSIDGSTDYEQGKKFAPDVKVVVVYHTFPKKAESTTTPSGAAPEQSESPKASGTSSAPSSTKASTASPSPTAPAVITVKNNPEFAAILKSTNSGDPAFAAFAKKYHGQKIEFDACVWDVTNYEKYKTRFTILIGAGDFDPNSSKGPNFQFRNVNTTYDLHILGEDVPPSVQAGQNIHVIAEVGDFNQTQELFHLTPVETRFR